ncbi:MAG TPA: 2-C-methyl-D-erythritol 4-phosphate cytidylyltransferase [Paenalcaligenes sp.]|nr:2-C-methyl-D-erythritol 4-phosphate cytidylyltransferase [Paenalcaligenes sp.]
MSEKIIAIVPAGGIGARARRGGAAALLKPDLPKQYELLRGLPMLRCSVQCLVDEPRIEQVRAIVRPEDTWAERALQGLKKTVWRHCGGPTRADTVRNALHDLQPDEDTWVLVHDAARPGLPFDALQRLIDTCLRTGQGGLLAIPVPDTLKRIAETTDGDASDVLFRVGQTINREGLWIAQTPQMFNGQALMRALDDAYEAAVEVTDEASAMERMGEQPLLIEGSVKNFKVTWPGDFQLMEQWL